MFLNWIWFSSGKQARRTNTSSPLGELFDHGCDSISTVFVAISTCASVQLGHYPTLMFFECFCVFALFYCAHWQTFVSGTLHFGKIDVTEAQVAIMCIHSLSGYFGPEIWRMRTMGFEPWYLIVGMTLLTGVLVVTDFITTIRKGGCGKNGSTIAGTSIISPILPFILVMFPAYVISRMSQSGIYENHPILYIMTFGLLISKVTNRLVVAHMTKSEMNWFDKGLIGPLMMILNQYFNEFIPEYLVLWLALLWIIFDLCMYCMLVCLEICKHLKIKLFKIPFNKRKQSITRASSDLNHNKKHWGVLYLGGKRDREEDVHWHICIYWYLLEILIKNRIINWLGNEWECRIIRRIYRRTKYFW